jgi:hypothetical protein
VHFTVLTALRVDPILKRLATGWERAFRIRLPKAFNTYVANSGTIIHNFHETVEERARDNGVGLASLSMLNTQIYNYEQIFKELGILLITQMTELRREANRDLTPTIAQVMSTVYDTCTSETGKGQYKRMKDFMRDHVEHGRHHMFNEAVKTVEKHLDAMCKALQESMEAKADEIFVQMNRDYMRLLGGIASDQPIRLQSREEAEMKSEIRGVLRSVDAQFEAIVNGELGSRDVAGDDTRMQDEEPIDVEDEEESGVFDAAQEFADHDVDDAQPSEPLSTTATSRTVTSRTVSRTALNKTATGRTFVPTAKAKTAQMTPADNEMDDM